MMKILFPLKAIIDFEKISHVSVSANSPEMLFWFGDNCQIVEFATRTDAQFALSKIYVHAAKKTALIEIHVDGDCSAITTEQEQTMEN